MAITKVWIEEGCISCGLCEEICPKVFIVKGLATLLPDVDFNDSEKGIIEAAESCPVEVIKFE